MQRWQLSILFMALPFLLGAYCNLQTRLEQVLAQKTVPAAVDENVVADFLKIAPFVTLTPTATPTLTPTATSLVKFLPGDDLFTATPGANTSSTEGQTPSSPNQPNNQPSPTPVSALVTPTPTLPQPLATPSPTSTATPIPTPPQPTAPPPTSPPPTATSTSVTAPTATPLPNLSTSVKIANPDPWGIAPFPGEVFPSAPISYTIIITNSSSTLAAGVTARDTLPLTFTLAGSSIYGPAASLSGATILWGPFNVPPFAQVKLGFTGTLNYNPPMGMRGHWVRNRAEINRPWLGAPLYRNADVFVVYPPNIVVVPTTLTPTLIAQNQGVTFTLDVKNIGSAWADLQNMTSYLLLTTTANITSYQIPLFTTPPVRALADTVPVTLTFTPISLSPPPVLGLYQANLHLAWLDENGVSDFEDYVNVGQMTVGGPRLHGEPDSTIPPIMAGATTFLRFNVWNEGNLPGETCPFDSIQISAPAADGWGNFTPLTSYNVPDPPGPVGSADMWVSAIISPTLVRWTMTPTYTGCYTWQPDPPPPNTAYVYVELGTMAPITPGIYTITIRTSLYNGAIWREEHYPLTVN